MKEKRNDIACTTAATLYKNQIHFPQAEFVLILPLLQNNIPYCFPIVFNPTAQAQCF